MEKLAQIKWGRGKFSEVFRSNIIDPSPLKAGQKVKVVWGESKREYAAVVECYPVEQYIPEPMQDETELPRRRARAKRKLIPDDFVEYTETETAAKKKKERPKKKILEVSSPPKGQYASDSDSEVSDSDDSSSNEDQPLISVISSAYQRPLQPDTAIDCHEESPPPPEISNENFLDFEDVDLPSGGEMIRRAMNTLEKTNDVCLSESRSQITAELQLARTILERLECSFARQEAKLDKLLNMMATAPSTVQQFCAPTPSSNHQSRQTVQQFSTPVPTQSLEYTTPSLYQQTSVSDRDGLFDDSDLAGISDTVAVGGSANVRISRDDYNHAISASKPSTMTLRFLDKLFSKETLLKSTLYGTKEFAALDPSRIFAIKTEVNRAFSYQCRNHEDSARIWDACKVSIGKRCQHLRKNEKENRQD